MFITVLSARGGSPQQIRWVVFNVVPVSRMSNTPGHTQAGRLVFTLKAHTDDQEEVNATSE